MAQAGISYRPGTGDLLRQQEKFAQAVPAYDKALSLLADAPPEERWFALYARGIALERSGDWPRAEAVARVALPARATLVPFPLRPVYRIALPRPAQATGPVHRSRP